MFASRHSYEKSLTTVDGIGLEMSSVSERLDVVSMVTAFIPNGLRPLAVSRTRFSQWYEKRIIHNGNEFLTFFQNDECCDFYQISRSCDICS